MQALTIAAMKKITEGKGIKVTRGGCQFHLHCQERHSEK